MVEHVKECNLERDTPTSEPESDAGFDIDISPPSDATNDDTNDSSSPSDLSDDQVPNDSNVDTSPTDSSSSQNEQVASPEEAATPPRRYPSRLRKPPERYDT